jgi:Beta-lactamase enzyme family
LRGAGQGQVVELQLLAHGRFLNIAHTTAARGRYRFVPLRLGRTSVVRVVEVPTGAVSSAIRLRVLVVLPASAGVRRAARYLASRAGTKAFAVVDDYGRLSGVNIHLKFHSASVVKSMLLAAYLRMLAKEGRGLSAAGRGLLYPMIHSSDNGAATAVLGVVGEQALDQVASAAGMRDYESGGATWGFTEVSAADLAGFFYNLGAIIPPRFYGYARWLLSTIEPSESWGIPAVARPGFQVLFKGGWLPEVEGLVNQVARLEGRGTHFALAILTRDDPSMSYGEQTLEGLTGALLGRAAK